MNTQKPELREKTPSKPKILSVGRAADAVNLDPYRRASVSAIVYQCIVENLLVNSVDWTRRPPIMAEPALARSYERLDELRWRFRLRTGVKFHCGEVEFDAHVAKWNYDRYLDPKKPGEDHALIKMIKHPVQVEDDYTLVLETLRPLGGLPLLAGLVQAPGIVCPKHARQYGDKFGIDYVDATGPFKFKSWEKGNCIRLAKNENYWRGSPRIDELIWKTIPEDVERKLAYDKGEINFLWDLPVESMPDLKRDTETLIVTHPGVRTRFMYFNNRKKPFTDRAVRHALCHAVDRENTVRSIAGDAGAAATGFLSPAVFGYHEVDLPKCDPDKARQILTELGWEPGPNGTLSKGGEKLSVVLVSTDARDVNDKEFAKAIGSQIGRIGIDVKTQVVDMARFFSIVREVDDPKWDIALNGWAAANGDADLALYSHWHSKGMGRDGWNFQCFSNKDFDRLVETGQKSSDTQDRLRVYGEAQEIMARELPALPLYDRLRLEAMRTYIKGYIQHPTELWTLAFWNVSIDKE